MTLEKELAKFKQVVPIVIIRIKGTGVQFIADGGTRYKSYGSDAKSIIHECKDLTEAFELWKGLVSHNPRATNEEKITKFTRLAGVLKGVFKVENGDMCNKLGELVNMDRSSIGKYLPDEYKMVSKNRVCVRHARKSNDVQQPKEEEDYNPHGTPSAEDLAKLPIEQPSWINSQEGSNQRLNILLQWLTQEPEVVFSLSEEGILRKINDILDKRLRRKKQ